MAAFPIMVTRSLHLERQLCVLSRDQWTIQDQNPDREWNGADNVGEYANIRKLYLICISEKPKPWQSATNA